MLLQASGGYPWLQWLVLNKVLEQQSFVIVRLSDGVLPFVTCKPAAKTRSKDQRRVGALKVSLVDVVINKERWTYWPTVQSPQHWGYQKGWQRRRVSFVVGRAAEAREQKGCDLSGEPWLPTG